MSSTIRSTNIDFSAYDERAMPWVWGRQQLKEGRKGHMQKREMVKQKLWLQVPNNLVKSRILQIAISKQLIKK